MSPPDDAALAPPPVGHNQPPEELSAVEVLLQRINKDHADVLKRAADLEAAFARTPEVIPDEDAAGKTADMVKFLRACIVAAEERHATEKRPYWDACKAIDGWLNKLRDPLQRAKDALERRLTVYGQAKAERERKAREAEAARLRAEAEKQVQQAITQEAAAAVVMAPVQSSNIAAIGHDAAAGELHVQFSNGTRFAYPDAGGELHAAMVAAPSKGQFFIARIKGKIQGRKLEGGVVEAPVDTDSAIQTAAALTTQARALEVSAQTAAPADLSRTRGDMGSVASLKRTVAYKVGDITKVPAHLLMVNDAAVKAHIKTRQKDQLPAPVAGLEFYWDEKATVR